MDEGEKDDILKFWSVSKFQSLDFDVKMTFVNNMS